MNDTVEMSSSRYTVSGSLGSNEIDLRDVLATILAGKWVIVGATAAAMFLAIVYVTLATPVYQADALIQVEDDRPALSGLADLTGALPSESAIGAEIEIVRSRTVLGNVVDEVGLTAVVEPNRFPFIGEFFARRHPTSSGVAEPLLPFTSSYGWGGESLDLRRFEVPDAQRAMDIQLVVAGGSSFQILSSGKVITEGHPEESLEFVDPQTGLTVFLNVRGMSGNPGMRFTLSYVPKLSAIVSLRKPLSVTEIGRDTGVMRLRIEGKDRRKLENILDSISNNYLRQNVERKSAEAQQSLAFLNDQLPQVRRDLEEAENRLARFREENKTIDLTIETESVLQKMVLLDQRLSELDLKRAELTRNYTSDHPVVQTLEEQRSQLLKEKQGLEAESSELPDVQQDLLRYMREVEVSTQLYTYMLYKVQELRVVEAGTVGNVRVLDHAAVAPMPVRPRKLLFIAFAVVLGGLVSVCALFLRRLLRMGVTDPDQVERALDVPVYSVLPFSEDARKAGREKRELIVVSTPDSIISEAFRSLRTSVHFGLGLSEECSVIAVSGPAPNVGKTFVSTNMAAMLAKAGHKVLYVDGDLRRGDGDSKLGVARTPGLSNLLANETRDIIQKCPGVPGLDVIARGKSPPNPAELVMSVRFSELMDEWRQCYDFVVLDTPPVLAVTDPVIIAKQADALFLVGRAGGTTIHELQECKTRFSRGGVPMKGVIINGMTQGLARNGQYGYGYYNYKYAPSND